MSATIIPLRRVFCFAQILWPPSGRRRRSPGARCGGSRWAPLEFLEEQIRNLPGGQPRQGLGALEPNEFVVALTEGWRGEIAHAVLTDSSGAIRRYKVKDPSFHNWSALALAMQGNQISDFPLCNKSFNLSYAGHDL
jgi:Ni,Fe-hydrogenase III large subunit